MALEKFLIAAKDNGIINDEQYGQLSAMMNEYQTSSEHSTLESTLDKTILSSDSSDPSVFEKMYNKLTLLNVLYFSGALLIMGAYSLFMTLAFEHFTQRRWADIIALQAAAFGAVGLLIWNTEYQFLGGLWVWMYVYICIVKTSSGVSVIIFCKCSTSHATNLWPEQAC